MLTPVFTHGTYDNTIIAIQEGKVRYPAYCWVTDRGQYGFLNRNNELEIIGIPEFTGTLDNQIIIANLNDGIYQIKGEHKITENDITTFSTSTFIIYLVQTINGVKKIKRITSDEIIDYVVESGGSLVVDAVVTESYLKDHGYADTAYIDAKMAVLEEEMRQYVDESIDEAIAGKVEPIVRQVVDEEIQDVPSEDIEDLFD